MDKSDKSKEVQQEELNSEQQPPVEEQKEEPAPEEAAPAEEQKEEAATPEEQPAETQTPDGAEAARQGGKSNDIKSFFSNKRNIAVAACAGAAVVALSLGLGLGLGLKHDEELPAKAAFAAPAEVTVTESTISWKAFANATNGYTLKFEESNKEMTLTVVSYNLLSDTSYLKVGVNSLYVKVNATDAYLESKYSAKVTYTYTPAQPEKPAFEKPTATLDSDGKTLKWNEVTGATSYTVKIGDTELEPTTKTSLDLTTVVDTSVTATYTVCVKVNATDNYKESEYSATVEYTYNSSADAEAVAYAELVKAIGSITADSTDTQAKAVAAAISTANDKYNGLSDETKALDEVIAAKAEFDKKKAAYDEVYNPAKAAYEIFVEALVEAAQIAAEEEDAAALNAKVTALNTAKGAFNNLAQSMLTEEQKNSYADVKETLTAWNTAIDEAKEIWAEVTAASFNAIEGADAQKLAKAEENIVKANGLIAQYSGEKYVQNAVIEGTTKISDKKAIADNALTAAKTAIENIVDEIKTTVDAFTGTIASDKVNEEHLAELNGYKGLVDGFGAYASTLWTAELTEKLTNEIEALKTAIAKAIAIAAAVEEINAAYGVLTDDDEEIIAAVNAFASGTYANYADYIKTDQGVRTAYGNLTEARNTAQDKIKNRINAIKTAVIAAIANDAPNEENYAALETQRDAIEGVTGAYASQYLTTLKIDEDDLITAVVKAMNKMLTTVVSSDGSEAYSISGTALKITLFKTFYNFRREKIATTGALAPKLTAGGNTVTVEQDFELNAINEYVAIINIENVGAMGNDASYTIGSETTPLKFGATIDNNPYFTDDDEIIDGEETGFKKAIVDGKFNMIFQSGCTAEHYYLEVYNADAITKDGDFVKFTEVPLGKIEITDKKNEEAMTIGQFTRFIANNSVLGDVFIGKSLNVRFMIYGTTVTNNVPAFTLMNASVISEAIKFNLVEEDKYYKLPVANIDNSIDTDDEGTMNLIVDERRSEIINFVNNTLADAGIVGTILNEDNYIYYLQMKIEVYDAADENQTTLHTKYTEIGFRNISVKEIIEEWQEDYFTEHGDAEETSYKIGIRISYCIKPNNSISEYFPRADYVEAGITYPDTNKQVRYEKDIVLSRQN